MSNLSVCATTTPYPVSNFSIVGSSSTTTYMSSSTTSKSASTTSVVTSSTTIKTVSSSTTISASTTAVKVATSSNTATISASTTSSYGTSSSNSISRQISSSTTTQSSSTTISSISRGAHVGSTPIVVNSSSTTPTASTTYTASTTPQSSSTTPQTAVSNNGVGVIDRNGTTITILSSSSTTPQSSVTIPYGTASTTPLSSSGTPIERNGGYITIYPNKPNIKTTYKILEVRLKELQGLKNINGLEVYSKDEADTLLKSLSEEYKSYLSRFCDTLEHTGINITGTLEIPMGEFQSPNFSVKLYAELSGCSTGKETPVELNASMNKFLEEEVSVDKLIDEFALTFAEGAEIKIDESRDTYIALQNDEVEITINYTAMARKKLEISVSKSYSLSDTLELSMNMDISIDIDDEFFKQVQMCSAEVGNEYYQELASENIELFSKDELNEIYKGIFDFERIFREMFDVQAGMDSIEQMNEDKIKSDVKEKMENLKTEGVE